MRRIVVIHLLGLINHGNGQLHDHGDFYSDPPSPSSSDDTALAKPPSTSKGGGEKKKAARGRSLTKEENSLTNTWIRVSENAIVGSDQKGEVFFKDTNDYH